MYNFDKIPPDIGTHPKITEPHERISVYVASSKVSKDDRLFDLRKFEYGDIVSYYNGVINA